MPVPIASWADFRQDIRAGAQNLVSFAECPRTDSVGNKRRSTSLLRLK
jgi:hypothetical protein